MARVTLQTVADRVGVSRMTVSNAFSKPDQLSVALRERILETAADLGYVGPDPAARALARGSVGSVGVLMTDSVSHAFDDEVATAFFGALAEGLNPTGLALSLISSAADGRPRARARSPHGRCHRLLLPGRLRGARLAPAPRAPPGVRRPAA